MKRLETLIWSKEACFRAIEVRSSEVDFLIERVASEPCYVVPSEVFEGSFTLTMLLKLF